MANLLRLARPRFLIASLVLFILAAFWAVLQGADLSFPRMVFAYLTVATAQLAVSFSNDYFDLEVDRLGTPSLFSGGSGVLIAHPEWRKPALIIALALTFISIALGVTFILAYAVPIWFLTLVLLSNAVGWCYSAPPLKLAYRGFGEILTAFTFGFLVPAVGFLSLKPSTTGSNLILALPLMFYSLAIILIVEIPDMETDRLGNKHTWVVRLGRPTIFITIGLLFFLASISLFLIAFLSAPTRYPDFRLFSILSLIPLSTAAFCIIEKPAQERQSLRYVYSLIASLAVLFIAIDGIVIAAAVH